MRVSVLIATLAVLSGCTGQAKNECGRRVQGMAPGALVSTTDGRFAAVASSWRFYDRCDNSFVEERHVLDVVDGLSGSSERFELPYTVGSGTLSGNEFLFVGSYASGTEVLRISTLPPRAVSLLVSPVGLRVEPTPGSTSLSIQGEAVFLGSDGGSIVFRRDEQNYVVPVAPGSRGLIAAGSRVYVVTSSATVSVVDAETRARLPDLIACPATGPACAIGSKLAVACATGGMAILDPVAASFVILEQDNQILALEGSETVSKGLRTSTATLGSATHAFDPASGPEQFYLEGPLDGGAVLVSATSALAVVGGYPVWLSLTGGTNSQIPGFSGRGVVGTLVVRSGDSVLFAASILPTLDLFWIHPETGEQTQPPLQLPAPEQF